MPRLCYEIKYNETIPNTKVACLNWGESVSDEEYKELHNNGKAILASTLNIDPSCVIPISEVEYEKLAV